MSAAYFDSTYLFKLQCVETGTVDVRTLASSVQFIQSAVHARAEFISACHRKVREGAATEAQLKALLAQFQLDCNEGVIRLLPLSDSVFARLETFYVSAPKSCVLRAADAMHLACAAENGCAEIYSNDRQLLAAAPYFGLKGINVIGPQP